MKNRDRRLRLKEERRGRNERLRAYSFFATLAIIAVVIGASYIASLPQVEHFPESLDFKSQAWMKYVPNHIEYILYVDLDSAFTLSGSPQLFGSEALLQLYQLNYSILSHDVSYEIDIQLPSPQFSGTVSIMKVHKDSFNTLQSKLANATETPTYPHQGYTIHGLLMRKSGDQKLLQGFIGIAEGYIILSNDQSAGRRNVERILDQFAFNAPSLFDDATVKRGVYATGVADQQYLGLYVGMFQTQLNYSRMIVKSVVQDGDGILVTRSIMFPSSDIAFDQFGEAHRIYRDAATYKILDSWLVVAYKYSANRLRAELSGI